MGAIYHPAIKAAKVWLVPVVNHCALSHVDRTQFQVFNPEAENWIRLKNKNGEREIQGHLKNYCINYQVAIITVYEAGLFA